MSDDKKINNKLESFFKSFSDADSLLDFRLAHETIGQKIPSISTASLVLDDALSSGGLPKGRLIQYYGAPGSGKTLMAMLAILEAQKESPDTQQVFIDAEQTFSAEWAETLGLDPSRIIIIDGDMAVNGRKCFEMLLGVPKEDKKTHMLSGKSKEGLFDKIMNKEFNINMIVLDSLGSIIPPGEDISAVGKFNMSLLARFLTTTFRKLSLEVNKANVPFIIINHKKDNMDPYGADHTFSGGNTYSHFLSANVYFDAVRSKEAQILDEREEKIGHTIRATIEKSKFGPWPRKCEFKVDFTKGVVGREYEVLELCLKYDIIKKPTTVSHEYGDKKWVGYDKCALGIMEDPILFEELINKISEVRNNGLDKQREQQEIKKVKNEETKKKPKKDKELSDE